MNQNKLNLNSLNFEKIADILIRLGVLFLLIGWCYDILKPFILIIVWAIVISVSLSPVYESMVKIFRGKKILATVLLALAVISILVVPSILVTKSLYDEIHNFTETYQANGHLIPPPGENTKTWPTFTKPILEIWQTASEDVSKVIMKYSDHFKAIGEWFLLALAGIGKGILQFIVSIIIAMGLLLYSNPLTTVSKNIFTKLIGKNGEHYALITVATIRNVVKGFLGVALIQSMMVGIGFFIAGVPFAGIFTIICLVLAIIQIGIGPIAIPVVIYMYSVTDTTSATLLAIWIGITLISDNILKPIFLGRGNPPAPMLVIFLGAIGGFIYNGFIGLFLGAVILTLGYKFFLSWIDIKEMTEEETIEA
ncbi:AI-2E family transporter [Flavobacterium granuli]|uniref:PurR-regulated permease PerM n=1 Tax=Flavobacterium granuli TaxID=280093 RepID=A0ABU1RYU0_9FLAO|nr:AI-2E family transporter [Flavobacterium granuli]MDR6843917.1 putative PurR-regulated permease PerM [Flavobacterium granuli]